MSGGSARLWHDAYAAIRHSIPPGLRRTRKPRDAQLIESSVVKQAGETVLDNTLEAALYGSAQKAPHDWPEMTLYKLRDMRCVGDQGHLFFRDGSFFEAAQTLQVQKDRKIRYPIELGARHITEPVFHLTGVSHENHGHFLLHHLPRLVAVLKLLMARPEIRILCASGHERWQGRYLERLGIEPGRIISTGHGTLRIDELYYVPRVHGRYNLVAPDIYQLMRDALTAPTLSEAETTRSSYPLFVSRRDAPDKVLANEDELVGIIGELCGGVNVVNLSEHGMDEQIRLFHSSPLVIGALGQGLTNLMYTHGSNLLVLDHRAGPVERGAVAMFRGLTSICGGMGAGLFAQTNYHGPNRAWHFDTGRFRADLRRAIGILRAHGAALEQTT